MIKNLKVVAMALAVVVFAITLWKGIPAVIGYIEGKAIAEVNARQQEESLNVQVELKDLTIDFNHDLSKQVAETTVYFNKVEDQIDELIEKRQADAVVLPETEIKGVQPKTPKPVTNKPGPAQPTPAVDDVSELTLAWQSFCKIRPSYKDCIEGTRP